MENKIINTNVNRKDISEHEKEAILCELDLNFSSYFKSNSHDTEYKTDSRGLLLPVCVVLTALILSILTIFLSEKLIERIRPFTDIPTATGNGESEWAVLKAYRDEMEEKINIKDDEIRTHKAKIAEYDRKLTALRELIELKKKTEDQLHAEKEKLILAGYSSEVIDSKILNMEESLLSDIPPDMIEFYSLSIDDLNTRIDRILDDRRGMERKLERSLEEKASLTMERQEINVSRNAVENPTGDPNSETTIPGESGESLLSRAELAREQRELFAIFIQSKYMEILDDLEADRFEASREKLSGLQKIFEERDWEKSLAAPENIEFHSTLVRVLQDHVESRLADRVEEGPAKEPVTAPPVAASPDAALPVTAAPALPEGRISEIHFNRITITCEEAILPEIDDEFTIIRDVDGEDITIGRGTVSDLSSSGSVQGEVNTLYDFSMKPETGDRILFQKGF